MLNTLYFFNDIKAPVCFSSKDAVTFQSENKASLTISYEGFTNGKYQVNVSVLHENFISNSSFISNRLIDALIKAKLDANSTLDLLAKKVIIH